MSSNFNIVLSPVNTWGNKTKSFKLPERVFKLGVRLVDKGGFRPNLVASIDKRDVMPFAAHLSSALATQDVDEGDRRVLEDLVNFLSGDGSKCRGLTIGRSWQ